MKTQNTRHEIPEERPYAYEPMIGFSAPVSKKPQNLYNQRSTTGFLTEGHRETKPEKNNEPMIGFNAQVSKKPQTLYNQRFNVGFLVEGHGETKPEKKYIEISSKPKTGFIK